VRRRPAQTLCSIEMSDTDSVRVTDAEVHDEPHPRHQSTDRASSSRLALRIDCQEPQPFYVAMEIPSRIFAISAVHPV
jgi:hypothetical protein